jgi:hypothetical protein
MTVPYYRKTRDPQSTGGMIIELEDAIRELEAENVALGKLEVVCEVLTSEEY